HLQNPADLKYVYRKEIGLCDNDLGGLSGQRVLFFDLDVLITDEIDSMIEYAEQLDDGNRLVIINDWNTKNNCVGQASCYSWRVGTLGFIKQDFEQRPKEIVARYYTASQEYLSAKVIEKWG